MNEFGLILNLFWRDNEFSMKDEGFYLNKVHEQLKKKL